MKTLGIGLLGCGTVGRQVALDLRDQADFLAGQAGACFELKRVAVRDLSVDRGLSFKEGVLTDDPMSVVTADDVDIVVELIGGVSLAYDLVVAALSAGKSVVTANKALLAERGQELFALASEKGADLFFEASVAGAIPIIKALRESLAGNRVKQMVGILNGTCNYILTRMEDENGDFDPILKDAMDQGYAEADPSLDIDGDDTAHKAMILTALAFNRFFDQSDLVVDGIRGMSLSDLQYAAELGYRIKLIGVIREEDGEVELRVHPALVPHERMLASVSGSFNAVMVDGHLSDTTVFYGRGAGGGPTASAVLGDLIDAGRNVVTGAAGRIPAIDGSGAVSLRAAADVRVRYYLRMELMDKPGVFSRISDCLGRHGISISSLLQKDAQVNTFVPAIVMTHTATEGAFREALQEIRDMDIVGEEIVSIRVEDFGEEL